MAVAAAGLLWSSSGLFIKVLSLSAWQIAGWRSLVAALTLWGIAHWKGERTRLHLDGNSLAAACAYTVVIVAFVLATKLTTAANAIFLQFTAPIYLLVLEPRVLGTTFQRRDAWAVALCLGGMALFFVGRLETGRLAGNLLGLLSGLSLATFTLLLRHRARLRPEESPAGAILLGNLMVTLVCLPALVQGGIPGPRPALALLFLGVVQLGVAYRLFASGVRRVSATVAMMTGMLEAVFNPIWVFLGTGERPGPLALVGGVIILGVIVARGRRG